MNNKNILLTFMVVILVLITGCANFVSVMPPDMDINNAKVVNQAIDLSQKDAQIAFFSTRPVKYLDKIISNTGFVFMMANDGSKMAYITGTFHSLESPISWSPDGQKFLAVTYNDDVSSYCISLIEQNDTKCLIKDGNTPNWSPDGRKVAYYMPQNQAFHPTLNLLDMESGASKLIVNLPDSKTPSSSTWSPDGNSLAYQVNNKTSTDKQIWIYSFLTAKESFLTRGEMPVWSPKGNEIAFIRDGQLQLLNLSTKQETHLLDEFKDISWPAWSPDGEKLLFVSFDSGNGDIYYIERYSKKVVKLTNDNFSDEAPSWRP